MDMTDIPDVDEAGGICGGWWAWGRFACGYGRHRPGFERGEPSWGYSYHTRSWGDVAGSSEVEPGEIHCNVLRDVRTEPVELHSGKYHL